MRNLLRRQGATQPRKPLRERLSDLTSAAARSARRSEAEVRKIGAVPFEAYAPDTPMRSLREWSADLAEYAPAMLLADHTLRMSKPELVDLIRKAAEADPEAVEGMFAALEAARDTLDGWSKLLNLARTRYLVAGCAATCAPDSAAASA